MNLLVSLPRYSDDKDRLAVARRTTLLQLMLRIKACLEPRRLKSHAQRDMGRFLVNAKDHGKGHSISVGSPSEVIGRLGQNSHKMVGNVLRAKVHLD